jgi:hypothetical protein
VRSVDRSLTIIVSILSNGYSWFIISWIRRGRFSSSLRAAIITDTFGSLSEDEISRILCLNNPEIIKIIKTKYIPKVRVRKKSIDYMVRKNPAIKK